MNLYPTGEDLGAPPAPADWTMALGVDGEGESACYFADVQCAGNHVCRLVITGARSEDEARRLLAVKARLWIADYLARPHTGSTAFGAIQ
jgi:hypothetical protein